MNVHQYVLANRPCDGAPAPRVLRISADDGVFWIAEADNSARLVRLPLPGSSRSDEAESSGPWSALEALASAGEAEAAGRWVRRLTPIIRKPLPTDADGVRP
jgi:hypothetical protein